MPKPGTGQESPSRNWWSSKAVSLPNASCSCYISAQFFQCASGHSEGAAKKNLCTGTWVKARGSHFVLRTGREVVFFFFFFFFPWTWNWCKLRETCKWNANFRSERSNRENGPTFLDFRFFPGIFHWDEPTKRFPFTAKPKFPEILTKWQAPSVSTFVITVPKLHNSERMSHESFWFSRGREETRH